MHWRRGSSDNGQVARKQRCGHWIFKEVFKKLSVRKKDASEGNLPKATGKLGTGTIAVAVQYETSSTLFSSHIGCVAFKR